MAVRDAAISVEAPGRAVPPALRLAGFCGAAQHLALSAAVALIVPRGRLGATDRPARRQLADRHRLRCTTASGGACGRRPGLCSRTRTAGRLDPALRAASLLSP